MLSRALKRLGVVFIGTIAIYACAVAIQNWYWNLGRTPVELITRAEQRLRGHPRAVRAIYPVLWRFRKLVAHDIDEALKQPFQIPQPPLPGSSRASALPLENLAGRRVLRVGPQREIRRIAQAAQLARDGDLVEIDPGEYAADVAVWSKDNLIIRGLGQGARLRAAGANAEGKAIWVIRGNRILVENIDFIDSKVPDGNGAGIRLERGDLTVRRCLFYGNQNGILTAGGDMSLEIENSEFAYNGAGDGYTHNLYVGAIRSLRIIGSYFHHANVGHLVKSRARDNLFLYNRITDDAGGRASYEVNLPNGGSATLVGNVIQQGTLTRNSHIVSFGEEGYREGPHRLTMSHNTIVNGHPHGGTFIRVMPGEVRTATRNNLLIGRGAIQISGMSESVGDVRLDADSLMAPALGDFRLVREVRLPPAPNAGTIDGTNLVPEKQYRHPLRTETLPGPLLRPGALQDGGPGAPESPAAAGR